LLGYLMYRSSVVPRGLAVLGLIGGPLVCISGVLVMFGVFKGFRPSPVLSPDYRGDSRLGLASAP
jgi:hypothetical protein